MSVINDAVRPTMGVIDGAQPVVVSRRGVAPSNAPSNARSNKEIAIRVHVNAMPACQAGVLRALVTPDFRNHDALPGCAGGPEALTTAMHWFDHAFSDQRVEVLHAVAEDDLVALHVVFSARHTGHFRGIAPTGKRFSVREMHMIRLVEGREAEHWALRDEAWLERELSTP